MCGIFGFIGNECCFQYGIDGLKQLQNRGYDSAGCCCVDEHRRELIIRKYASIGNTDSLKTLEKDHKYFSNYTNGIFHTRWATHGAKTDKNSHPHIDNLNNIALAHNGVIENYHELKQKLINIYGIEFTSETDTEVIVNLLSIHYDQTVDQDGKKHMMMAIRRTIDELRGTWALTIICRDQPDKMYCVKYSSPLLIGLGESYIMVTSELAGFGSHVKRYICLHDNDIAVLKKHDLTVSFNLIDRYELLVMPVQNFDLSPYPYQHWTIKEIHEQYEASIRAIDGRLVDRNIVLDELQPYINGLKNIDHLILLGCGTSLNACNYSMYFFKDLCNFTTVQSFDGSEFTADDIPKKGNACAFFLSQSGETNDLYRCLELCSNKNIFTIGVINVVGSLIARHVDAVCYLRAGREVGVASTKAFTNQVIVMSTIAIFFAQITNVQQSKINLYIDSLIRLPTDLKHTLDHSIARSIDVADYLKDHQKLFILGKGLNVSCAAEGSLKIKEIGYIHAEAYGGNALRHGSYAIIDEGTPIITLCSDDNNFMRMISIIEEIKSREAHPIIISDIAYSFQYTPHIIIVPRNVIYKGILNVIPMQFIAYYLAIAKGHNPDMPKNLSKCVSV